jgi:hypothetical protein
LESTIGNGFELPKQGLAAWLGDEQIERGVLSDMIEEFNRAVLFVGHYCGFSITGHQDRFGQL